MTGESAPASSTDWLALPEVAALIGTSTGRVRQLLEDRQLVGSRRDGAVRVPAVFLVDGAPLPSLRGTLFALHDAGFTDDEAIDWLLAPDDSIGAAPIEALRAGRKSEVRRVARSLG
ncbi:Rv2175c family DNA-binding protein [Microbacterium sp.]|uniref:Rv2175c family DNA-binding protein n=1 Tax=Microbacterium sp. TaxID=51671 RepID=UPI0039E3C8C1